MRVIVFLLMTTVTFLSNLCLAQNSISELPNFNYIRSTPRPSDTEPLHRAVSQLASEEDLNLVQLVRSTSLSALDLIYSTGDLRTSVFLKSGVTPSNTFLNNKTVLLKTDLLIHATQGATSYMLWIRSPSLATSEKLYRKFKAELSVKTSSKFSVLMNKAWANSPSQTEDCSLIVKKYREIKQTISSSLKGNGPAQEAVGCFMGVLEGAADTIGSTYDLVTSPVETGKKFLTGVEQTWEAIKRFQQDFNTEAGKVIAGFEQMDTFAKANLACDVLTKIGIGIVVSYFTLGAGAPKTVAAIGKALLFLKLHALPGAAYRRLEAASTLIEIDSANKINFMAAPEKFTGRAAELNAKVLTALKEADLPNSHRRVVLSEVEAQKLYDKIANHPVTEICKIAKYDPQGKGIGFCFGRATATHFEALRAGVDKDQIRKIWAVGELTKDGRDWGYHVATTVRAQDGSWYAIDPVFGKLMKVEDWYMEMKKNDAAGNMRIYTTEARRHYPHNPKKYDKESMESEHLNGYYEDLLKMSKEESRQIVEQRRATHK